MSRVYLTTEEASAFLNAPAPTLCNWRIRGGGPKFLKFGRLLRYAEADLEAFAEAVIRTSTSDPGSTPKV